jgi:hypothetical protein
MSNTKPAVALTLNLILDPQQLFERMQEWMGLGYHVLTPATRVSHFAPNWGVSVSMVYLDPHVDAENGRGTDTYFDASTMKKVKGVPVERGISRIGLQKISQCAGISWDPIHSGRTDTRKIMHLWEFRMIGVLFNFEGQPVTLHGTGEVDLRDESAQIGGWTPALWRQELDAAHAERRDVKPIGGWSDRRVLSARAHGLPRCETQAMERAIRSIGIRHIYTVDELSKPFVALRAAYLPNMADPEVRAMVTEQGIRGTRALFAPVSKPIPVIDITPRAPEFEPPTPPASSTTSVATPSITQTAAPPVSESKPAPAVHPPAASSSPTTPPGPATTAAASTSSPALSAPFTPGEKSPGWRRSARVMDVQVLRSGTNRRGAWALSKIVIGIASALESHTTLDRSIASAAQDAKDKLIVVDVNVQFDEKDEYLNLVEILPAGQQQALPGVLETELPAGDNQKW